MLNMQNPNPISSCSKASRGLFVRLRVKSIFTHLAISPSTSLREFSSRYAIRAGRNLPDKEFRYLRTVIVTATVHQGLDSGREPLLVTFWHWAGISPYTSACAFAETCVFVKQSPGVFRCGSPCGDQSLSRSYGRYFAEFLNASFLEHLRILILPTGVGLRYGPF